MKTIMVSPMQERERERDTERERETEREIHYVHSASLAYEDGIVLMSEPSAARQ